MLRGKRCSNRTPTLVPTSTAIAVSAHHACLSECRSVASNHESLGPAACMCPAAVPGCMYLCLCALRVQRVTREVGGGRGTRRGVVGGICGDDRLTGTDSKLFLSQSQSLRLRPSSCFPVSSTKSPNLEQRCRDCVVSLVPPLGEPRCVSLSGFWGPQNHPNDRPSRWESCEFQAKFQVLRMIFSLLFWTVP